MIPVSTSTYNLLLSILSEMKEHPDTFVLRPGFDFSRYRKISFQDTMLFFMAAQGKSLSMETYDFFSHRGNTPSESALLQRRAKIKIEAFHYLLTEFNRRLADEKTYNGYRILACDGSDLNIFYDPSDKASLHAPGRGEKGFNQLHINALYNICTRRYVDILIEKGMEYNESVSLIKMVKRLDSNKKTIILADRGYETYNVFAHIIEKGMFFAIRIKDVTSKGGISFGFHLPDHELDKELDYFVTRSTALSKKEPLLYKRVTPNSPFEFLDSKEQGTRAVYQMKTRLVRFQLDTGEYECIMTNLDKDEFPPEKIKELYNLRWGIETSFRKLKYSIGLSHLHSKKAEYVEQEIYARVIMYNFCEYITSHVIVKQKNTKYQYQVNFTMAVHICKCFLRNASHTIPPDVDDNILRYTVPIKPGRKFPRHRVRKGFVSFLYRVA